MSSLCSSGISPDLLAAVCAAIASTEGGSRRITQVRPVAGRCISRNFCLGNQGEHYFLRLAPNAQTMFSAEIDGLAAMTRRDALVVLRVITQGQAKGLDFLGLEWLDLSPEGDEA